MRKTSSSGALTHGLTSSKSLFLKPLNVRVVQQSGKLRYIYIFLLIKKNNVSVLMDVGYKLNYISLNIDYVESANRF